MENAINEYRISVSKITELIEKKVIERTKLENELEKMKSNIKKSIFSVKSFIRPIDDVAKIKAEIEIINTEIVTYKETLLDFSGELNEKIKKIIVVANNNLEQISTVHEKNKQRLEELELEKNRLEVETSSNEFNKKRNLIYNKIYNELNPLLHSNFSDEEIAKMENNPNFMMIKIQNILNN